tara:strand:- start:1218 stop:1892 length:675 start_codon:yes stop_codon:yes gene_type:complete
MHQSISKKIILYLFLFFFLVTISNTTIRNFSLPKINKIKISGLNLSEAKEIENVIQNLNFQSLFFINKLDFKEKINSIKFIEEFSIFKKYPSTLIIDIKKTKFLAIIKKDGSDYLLGSNGKLIKNNTMISNLPYIFGDPDAKEFLKFKYKVDKSKLSFNKISKMYFFKSKRWDIETSKGYLIKLPTNDIESSLNLFISLQAENFFQDNTIVDLRQKNQIILNGK